MLRHAFLSLAALVLSFNLASLHAAPALPGSKAGGVFVLDDCDPDFQGKAEYRDNLSYYDGTGKLVFRVSGLNTCQMIGSNRQIAHDSARGHVWVAESVAGQVRKFDLDGKELLAIKDVKPTAIAVDPDTGNLWVLRTAGPIDVAVFDMKGKPIATHVAAGFDLAYDRKSKAFWVAGKDLTKLSAADGKQLAQTPISTWSASSLAVHQDTGRVWVGVRQHAQVAGSSNQLLALDQNGKQVHAIDLGDRSPFNVTVDARTGAAWVSLIRSRLRRYSPEGELTMDRDIPAITAHADQATGDVWVVTKDEVLRMTARGEIKKRVKHAAESLQAWAGGP
jgi:DNA-binding beta-propeller fold protein YncE